MPNVLPRGIRNCNPGNVVYNKNNDWEGQLRPDGRYCRFTTPEKGIRAMAKILVRYNLAGCNTLESIIRRWAPTFENDTEEYIDAVCEWTGLERNWVVTTLDYPSLIGAIIRFENGENPYEPDVIDRGIKQAFVSR